MTPLTTAIRPDWSQALTRISWLGHLLSSRVLSPKLKLSTLAVLAGFCLLVPGTALAEPISNANATILGPNVYVFDTNMANADIQGVLNNVYNEMQTAQFASQGYALLFKPGTYYVDCNVGFYTQVAGLGQNPDDVLINGGVNVNAQWYNGEALNNFWRTEENFAVLPTASDTNTDTTPGVTRIAVSQAAPMRRLHVKGELALFDLWPSCHCGAGYASGGFLGDSKVDGLVDSGSQQQWLSRNSTWGSWGGGAWNMVFVGCQNAPANTFPSSPNTTVAATPVIREKPYLYVDGSGNFAVFVPSLQTSTVGTTWANGSTPGTSIPISQFYIAQPATDTAATLNAALAAGKNILFTPGTYSLNGTLTVNNANTILLGLGVPSLKAMTGLPVISVADVDGVTIAGLIIDAGPVDSPVLLQVGPNRSSANHSANPTCLYDLTVRTGGPAAAQDDAGVVINSGNVVLDDTWIWRADHGSGVGWTANPTKIGLIINGNNVTCYGLFNEHHEQNQTLWNGNGGRVYMYQSEIPYDVPNQTSWMDGNVDGYASYKVANNVTNHEAWGLGIYCYFIDAPAILNSAIEAPDTVGVRLHDLTTVWLGQVSGSQITHIVNNIGGTVYASSPTAAFIQTLTNFIGSGSFTNSPLPPTGLVATAGNAQVALTWIASTNATSYNVKRSSVSGGETTLATVTTTNYADAGLNNGTTYYYEVSAVNGNGEGANSAEVSATPHTIPPSAPTGLGAVAGNARVILIWMPSAGAMSYNLKRSTTSGAETAITNMATPGYADMGVANGTTYYYEVSAVNSGGESANSVEVIATPQVKPQASGIVLYQQDWGTTNGNTNATSLSQVAWSQAGSSDFRSGLFVNGGVVDDATGLGLPKNSMWFGDNNPGLAMFYTTNGAGAGIYGDSAFTSIDPKQYPNLEFSAYSQWGWNGSALQCWFAVQIGGAWYLATNHPIVADETGQYLRTDMTYSPAPTNWNNLTVNSNVAIGGPVASDLSGPITGVGLVAESTGGWWNVNEFQVASVAVMPITLGSIVAGAVSGNSLTLNWTASPNVHLQSATNLVPPVVWTDVPNTTGQSSVAITTTNIKKFFRLIQP